MKKVKKKTRTKIIICKTLSGKIKLVHYSDIGLVAEFHITSPSFYVKLEELEKVVSLFKENAKYYRKNKT